MTAVPMVTSTRSAVPGRPGHMITRVRMVRFKRFADETFDLAGNSVVLAGPNNSGKTTLLHALSTWNLVLQRWLQERGTVSEAARRISLTLDEFTALPIREMNLLWLDRHTSRKPKDAKTPKNAPIYIEVAAKPPNQPEVSLTMELLYANEKLVYVRPVASPDDTTTTVREIPVAMTDLSIAHVPAFSGIGTQEARHAPGMQNKLLGEGRAGEIVRNLLVGIWEESQRDEQRGPWKNLVDDIRRFFQFELLPPEYSERHPYIVCEYRPSVLRAKNMRGPKLDIANAGSGFHQVLLLLSFFYGKPSSVLLLDEPDAHLHVILQREVADHLRLVAAKQRCKLLIATHAEVLLNGAEPDEIVSFVGQHPRRLLSHSDKRDLSDALETLTSLDLLQAHHAGAVLYVEDEGDWKILREWARVLDHPALMFLANPYLWPMRGKGNFERARTHFKCLKHAFKGITGVCVLDGDGERAPASANAGPEGFGVFRWKRYEIENYLINPDVLRRYIRGDDPEPILFEVFVTEAFGKNFPAKVDWLDDSVRALVDVKGSRFLVDTLAKSVAPLEKRDLYMLAAHMKPSEIHADVRQCLDVIAKLAPAVSPIVEANATLPDEGGIEA